MPLSQCVVCVGNLRLMMLRLGFPEIGFDEALGFARLYGGGR